MRIALKYLIPGSAAGHDRKRTRYFLYGENAMKYFAALLMMKDLEKNVSFRQQHIDFLTKNEKEGKIFARGRFNDNSGGLVIYIASSLEDAQKLAASDPYAVSGARSLEVHEWDMKVMSIH
jgi:uncharacterized protein YciI